MHSVSQPIAIASQSKKWPALFAVLLGVFVVAGAGFAGPSSIHNATHDTRHAFGLPCH